MKEIKILYLVRHDLSVDDGVTKKIRSIIDYWESMGIIVKLVNVLDYSNGKTRELFVSNKCLIDLIEKFNPDLVYMRYQRWIRSFDYLTSYKIIMELNTVVSDEFKSVLKDNKNLSSFFNYIYQFYTWSKTIKFSSGAVFVSHEIKNHYKKYLDGIVHPNLINISAKRLEKKCNNKKELFFIGSPGLIWHGVDRIQNIAKHMPDTIFNIVGIESSSYDNVIFHGYLNSYSHILQRCCACLGSMALDRKNMHEASSLKVREYITSGFPIILSHPDTSFMSLKDTPPWLLTINPEDAVSSSKMISNFILSISDYLIPNEDRHIISYEYQEINRVNYLKRIANVI